MAIAANGKVLREVTRDFAIRLNGKKIAEWPRYNDTSERKSYEIAVFFLFFAPAFSNESLVILRE